MHIDRKELVNRIAGYMASQGYKIIEKDFSENIVRLVNDSLEIVIRIVEEDSGRGDLLSVVIQSAFDAAMGKVAYVALPLRLLSRIGDHAFRLHKIGLIVYSEDKVTELVSGGVKIISETKANTSIDKIEHLEAMIDSLSSRLERVEESLSTISKIEDLSRRLEELEYIIIKNPDATYAKPSKGLETHVIKTDSLQEFKGRKDKRHNKDKLPSFLTENPWVEILSEKT